MKKFSWKLVILIFTLFVNYSAIAQPGIITTFAPISSYNLAVDNFGRLYTASGNYVYRVDSGGAETIVAGGGTSYGDGGPATAAQISAAFNVAFDNAGNMYIADGVAGVIRKVNTSGIISTVAGNHSLGAGYTGDGGAATAAQVTCGHVCVGGFGRIFIADHIHNVVRSVDTFGIITTVAGNGTAGHSGDGGLATAASIKFYSTINYYGIAVDYYGNLYISEGNNYYVRKVNSAGIITTIAGNGSTLPNGISGSAIAAGTNYPQGLATDKLGNLYIAEFANKTVTRVDPAGIISTIAGNYTTVGYGGDGGPATNATMGSVPDIAIDFSGNIYISDFINHYVRKVYGLASVFTYRADSFYININPLCSGPQMNIITHSYNPSYSFKTYFGDGTSNTTSLTGTFTGAGYAAFSHAYASSGTYTIKTVLMNGSTAFDSISYNYEFRLCNTISSKYYYDANSDCLFDAGDTHIVLPVLTEVDSNGIAIDTISSTSGIYYTAYGVPGDIYTFKIISYPGSLHATCPSTGIITDTLQTSTYNDSVKSIGLQCYSSSNYDLSVHAMVPVSGVHDQWGHIYVSNSYCVPETATVTLHYDRHYKFVLGSGFNYAHPIPASYTDSTITWIVSALTAYDPAPVDLSYLIWVNPDSGIVVGYPAHSYYTISPTISDVDTSNNHETRIDTVKGGIDPNEMVVEPSGYIPSGTQLKYTIEFTNTGNDTAFNIYVMDTLSDNVDINTFRLVMAAAPMNIAKLRSGGHNILKFDFPNINLLDSMHYPPDCSSGLIYTIDSKPGLADGTTIFNHAGIFFDYNPVVTTNTVENIIGIPHTGSLHSLGINNSGVRIYPNPAKTELHIDNVQITTLCTLSNILGVELQTGNLCPGNNSINIERLPQGMYFIKINGGEVLKFVKN